MAMRRRNAAAATKSELRQRHNVASAASASSSASSSSSVSGMNNNLQGSLANGTSHATANAGSHASNSSKSKDGGKKKERRAARHSSTQNSTSHSKATTATTTVPSASSNPAASQPSSTTLTSSGAAASSAATVSAASSTTTAAAASTAPVPSSSVFSPASFFSFFGERFHSSPLQQQTRFELTLFFYLLIHLFLQNFNIYYLNFHNYNFCLLFLTIIILFKRVLACYWNHVKWENPLRMSASQICLNLVIIVIILSNSLYLLLQLFLTHPFKNFLFLFYPALVYFGFFGGQSGSNAGSKQPTDSGTEWFIYRFKRLAYSSLECGYFAGFLPLRFLQHEHLYYDSVRCTLLVAYVFVNSFVMLFAHLLSSSFNELYLHSQMLGCWRICSSPSGHAFIGVRGENGVKGEELSSKDAIGDDAPGSCSTVSGIKYSCSGDSPSSPTRLLSTSLTSTSTKDRPKAKTKSKERGEEGERTTGHVRKVPQWSAAHAPYRKGVLVEHRGKLYVAVGQQNMAEPGLLLPCLIFYLFAKPDRIHTCLIVFQFLVALSQLALLLNSNHWNVYGMMLLCNYYILYLCVKTRSDNQSAWPAVQAQSFHKLHTHQQLASTASSSLSITQPS
ncbi:Transmembrane protein 39A [Balamuthia mandrillaris]